MEYFVADSICPHLWFDEVSGMQTQTCSMKLLWILGRKNFFWPQINLLVAILQSYTQLAMNYLKNRGKYPVSDCLSRSPGCTPHSSFLQMCTLEQEEPAGWMVHAGSAASVRHCTRGLWNTTSGRDRPTLLSPSIVPYSLLSSLSLSLHLCLTLFQSAFWINW